MGLPSGWQTPRMNWDKTSFLSPDDIIRIEQNINAIENGIRSIDDTKAPQSSGNLHDILDYFANRLKAITGKNSWLESPDINLSNIPNDISTIIYTLLANMSGDYSKLESYNILDGWTDNAWRSSVVVRNTVVFVPFSATKVIFMDFQTKSYTGVDVASGSGKWDSCIRAGNIVYGIPYWRPYVLKIDAVAKTVTEIEIPDGFQGGTPGYYTAVLGQDNCIYFIPHYENCLLKFNPSDNSFTRIGSFPGMANYAGGVLAPNGYIYFIPHAAQRVLKVAFDGTATEIGSTYTETFQWWGGVLVGGRYIYCCPCNASSVLIIDTATDTTTTIGSLGTEEQKYRGAILLPNNDILFLGYTSGKILRVYTRDNTLVEISNTYFSGMFQAGGCLAPDGSVFTNPFRSSGGARLTFGDPSISTYWHGL